MLGGTLAAQLSLGVLLIQLRPEQVLVVLLVIGAVHLLVTVTILRLAAKGIVLRDCIRDSHAVFSAFGELFDVQPDLLGQQLR